MHRHTKGSVSARLPLPRELPIGAAIGVGACHVKQIQTKYGVRYQVDAKKREVVVTGPRATVDDAIDGIQDLFHRLRLERLQHRERQLQQRYLQNAGVNRAQHRVYRIAAASGTSQDSWMFQRRPDIDGVDERFENRLICLESFNNDEDEEGDEDENAAHEGGDPSAEGNWIEKFDASFQRRMVQDVETLVEKRGLPSTIKIKAALGFTNFDLPNASTACRLYTWQQLQQLQLHKDFRRRWENTCNIRSETVATLMHTLKSRVPHGASYETALTVYLGSDNATIRDFSVKFLWTHGQWSPVTSRYPCREPHGLYNISLDNETAFRVRVYSREYPTNWETYASVWDEFELIQHPSDDPLRTEVKLRDGHSTDMFIRKVWLREKTRVDYEGIRFSISFSNADHTDAIIQCQAVPTDDS